MPQPRAAVILAAGKGTRMRSSRSKVLHEVGGRAMLDWAVDLARSLRADPIVVVYGAHAPDVAARARKAGCAAALQDPPLGTGHAVLAAQDALGGFSGDVVVLYADTPLIRAETVEAAFSALDPASVAVLGFEAQEPGGYGRLIRDGDGGLSRIVEAKDASPDELAVTLCNSGVMAGRAERLFFHLANVTNTNAKGEYYLTDVVELARASGEGVAVVTGAEAEFQGVNSRVDLAHAEAAFQDRARRAAMEAGVTLRAPDTVHFAHDTALAADVDVEPHVVFGPGVQVESGASVRAFSHLEGCVVREGAVVGPYARLRPGADVGPDARVGNFVEVKNTTLGAGAKASHLTYLGDASVGAGANIGAGTITCNYDGFSKHKTEIGAGAFIGSNSSLVAPVTIGEGAYVGSGSVITKPVSADALAVARGRQIEKGGWAIGFRAKNQREDA